jgi:hypothetical protein
VGAQVELLAFQARVARSFVGRQKELASLHQLFSDGGPKLCYVRGPGGSGKSTLLRAFREQAQPIDTVVLEGSSAPSAGARLIRQMLHDLDEPDLDTALRRPGPTLLVVDGFNELPGLETFVVRDLIPRLGPGWRVLMAGRDAPSARLGGELRLNGFTLELGGLTRADAHEMLARHGRPAALAPRLHALTAGHALAMDMAVRVDQLEALVDVGFEEHPQILQGVLEVVVGELAHELHRRTLWIAALSRRVDRQQLRQLLGDDGDEAFRWLTQQTYVTLQRDGVRVHDVVKEAVRGKLKWMDRESYEQLTWEIREAALVRMEEAALLRDVRDAVYLLGDSPLWREVFVDRTAFDVGLLRQAYDDEVIVVRDAIEEHHCPGDHARLDDWLRAGGELDIFTDGEGGVAGWQVRLPPESLAPLAEVDPIVAWIGEELAKMGWTNPTTLNVVRSWGSVAYGDHDAALNTRGFTNVVTRAMDAGGRGVVVVVNQDAEHWRRMSGVSDTSRLLERDFDGETLGLAVHDFRFRSIVGWMRRQIFGMRNQIATAEVALFDDEAFACGVRDVLKRMGRNRALAQPSAGGLAAGVGALRAGSVRGRGGRGGAGGGAAQCGAGCRGRYARLRRTHPRRAAPHLRRTRRQAARCGVGPRAELRHLPAAARLGRGVRHRDPVGRGSRGSLS